MYLSVLLPAYNSAAYIATAIESVLTQTHCEIELILIDDGSTDSTLEIMRHYEQRDERIRVITHPNWGMGASLNHAMQIAKHDWIARMDADDIMDPRRLERQIAFIGENPELDVTGTLVTYIDEEGNEFGRSHPVGTTRESINDSRGFGIISGVYHPTVLMRSVVVQAVGGYRPQFWPADDIDLWTRIDDAGGAILVQPEYLLRYRVHGGSSAFGKALEVQVIREWIRACTLSRRVRQPEPSWEEFIDERESRPFLRRINQQRREVADACYRTAILAYGTHRYAKMALHVTGATLLGSPHIRRQIQWRLLQPITSRVSGTAGT